MYFYSGIDDLYDIKRELSNVAHKWKDIGLALRLHPDKLETIEADCHDSKSCLRKTLTEWLKKSYNTTRFGPPSWTLLVAAVADDGGGNDRALAEKIARKHNGKGETFAVLFPCFTLNIASLCFSPSLYLLTFLFFPFSAAPSQLFGLITSWPEN